MVLPTFARACGNAAKTSQRDDKTGLRSPSACVHNQFAHSKSIIIIPLVSFPYFRNVTSRRRVLTIAFFHVVHTATHHTVETSDYKTQRRASEYEAKRSALFLPAQSINLSSVHPSTPLSLPLLRALKNPSYHRPTLSKKRVCFCSVWRTLYNKQPTFIHS